jgi:glycerol kinase
VLCVPALARESHHGAASPASACLTGMTLSSTRGHVVQALLEGIAAQVASLTALVAKDLGTPLTRLRVDGGLTRSARLMQSQADLAQIPVDVYPSSHATPLGAAACARLALEPELDLRRTVGSWVPESSYEPRWSADRAATFLESWQSTAVTPSMKESTKW